MSSFRSIVFTKFIVMVMEDSKRHCRYTILCGWPTIWNQLPIAIKSSEAIDTFRKKLKTYLFEIAFPP